MAGKASKMLFPTTAIDGVIDVAYCRPSGADFDDGWRRRVMPAQA